jgi:hypothetical protein
MLLIRFLYYYNETEHAIDEPGPRFQLHLLAGLPILTIKLHRIMRR